MKWDDSPQGKEYRKRYHAEYYKQNKEKLLLQQRERLQDPNKKAQKNKKDRDRHIDYKAKIYDVLGGAKCIQCGYDTDERALQLDHINGDGHKHRKVFFNQATKYWLHYRDKPEQLKDVFQILCANCNFIKKYENHE